MQNCIPAIQRAISTTYCTAATIVRCSATIPPHRGRLLLAVARGRAMRSALVHGLFEKLEITMTDMTVAMGNGSDQGELIAELNRLKAENAKLVAKALARQQARINCKVSEKGALSIYGLGRFPVTLYLSQYEALNAAWPVVQEFVEDHRSEFATKD